MKIKFKHTNIIAHDWRKLAKFYQEALNCIPIPPERNLSGEWLDKGTGVKAACFSGVHLRLPGYEGNGPTLEVYQYSQNESKPPTAVNREGIMHLAFEVDNVREVTEEILRHGGRKIGDVSSSEVENVGLLTFIYLADPEGNIIELQSWK